MLASPLRLLVEWPTLHVITPSSAPRSFRSPRWDRSVMLRQAYRLGRDASGVSYSRESASQWVPSLLYGGAETPTAGAVGMARPVQRRAESLSGGGLAPGRGGAPACVEVKSDGSPSDASGTTTSDASVDEGEDSEPRAGRRPATAAISTCKRLSRLYSVTILDPATILS